MKRYVRSTLLVSIGFLLGCVATLIGIESGWVLLLKKPVDTERSLPGTTTAHRPEVPSEALDVNADAAWMQALDAQNTDYVFRLLESLPKQDSVYQAHLFQLYQYLDRLYAGQQWSSLGAWLDAGLQWRFSDVHLLKLSGQRFLAMGNDRKGVERLFQAFDASLAVSEQQRILHEIEAALQKRLQKAKQAAAETPIQDNLLLTLMDEVLEKQPQHPPFVLMQADIEVSQGNLDAALQRLQWLPFDEAYQSQVDAAITQLERRLAQQQKEQSGIALERENDQFFVQVIINQQVTLRLMIDTGASMTALTPDAIRVIQAATGLQDTGNRVKVSTANGNLVSPIYLAQQFQIEEWALNQVELLQIGQGRPGLDGLLGMNVLGQFAFHIDQTAQRLYLSSH